jgi:hypothetical protein
MSDQLPSDERFAVGEIAIAIHSEHGRLDGEEVIVTHPYGPYLSINGGLAYGYVVEWQGEQYLARPHQLRKKRPPREDLQVVRWDQCPWQPERIHG